MFNRAGLAALALLLGSTPVTAQQQDPFVGAWKMNLAKTRFDPVSGTPKYPVTITMEALGNNTYKRTIDGRDAQGNAIHAEDTQTQDGKDTPVKGNPNFDTNTLTRIDANTLIVVHKKGGVVVGMNRVVVSQDGKTEEDDEVGYDARGVSYHLVVVSDKQ